MFPLVCRHYNNKALFSLIIMICLEGGFNNVEKNKCPNFLILNPPETYSKSQTALQGILNTTFGGGGISRRFMHVTSNPGSIVVRIVPLERGKLYSGHPANFDATVKGGLDRSHGLGKVIHVRGLDVIELSYPVRKSIDDRKGYFCSKYISITWSTRV